MGLVRVVVLSNSSDLVKLVLRACINDIGGTVDGIENNATLRSSWRRGNSPTLLEAFHPTNNDGLAAALYDTHAVLIAVDARRERAHDLEPLLAVARDSLRSRAARGVAPPFAAICARQHLTDPYRDLLDATASLEVSWLHGEPYFAIQEFPARAIAALGALQRGLNRHDRPADLMRPSPPPLRWAREQFFEQASPAKAVAATHGRLLLGNTAGTIVAHAFASDGLIDEASAVWEADLVAGPFARSARGRVSVTLAGELVYVRDGRTTTPAVLDLGLKNPSCFDVHGPLLLVGDDRGVHAFELVDEAELDEPRVRVRWRLPTREHYEEALNLTLRDSPHNVVWVAARRALVDTVAGHRYLVDGLTGEQSRLGGTSPAPERTYAVGSSRDRVFSVGAQGVRLLHTETFLPVEVTAHPMRDATDLRVVVSPNERHLLLYSREHGAAILRAGSFSTQLWHRPPGATLCCDWLDDETAVVVHETGVNQLSLPGFDVVLEPPMVGPPQRASVTTEVARVVVLCTEPPLAARALEGLARLSGASVSGDCAVVPAWWQQAEATITVHVVHSIHKADVEDLVAKSDALLLLTDTNDWRAAKLEPLVRQARHACDARASRGQPVPFATLLIVQDGYPHFRDLLAVMSVLTVRWLPEGPMAETHWGLHGALWTMVESLARAALRSGTMVSRSGEPRVRYDGPVHRSPACASFPPRSIAASPTRLVLSNPVGPVEVFGINTSGLVVGRSYKWEGECIDGPFGRTAFGRVTLTSSGSLLYLHDEVRGISTPMVLALPDVSGVAFDCHANVLVVASPTGVHAFDLVERDRAAPPSIELRWHVPYAAEAAKTRRLSLASGVAWLPDGRVVVEWLNGDRVIVDRRSGEVGPIDSTGRRNLHVVSGGPNRERVFSVGMTHMSRLDSVTLEPTIEIEHHMSSADVLALPSPSGSRVLVFGRQQHLLVLRADTLDIEHQHRTDGELYCADWIDDDTVAIAHSSGVDTLLLRQPLTAPTAAP